MSDSIADVMEPAPGEPSKKSKGDLGVRTVSAVVMLVVAIGAFWAGGWIWTTFVASIGIGLLWEYWNLIGRIAQSNFTRIACMVGGLVYFGLAIYLVIEMPRQQPDGRLVFMTILCSVIATDVGAYFVGRKVGGPKIAPSISPSKTWSGLVGGMLLSGACFALIIVFVQVSADLPVSAFVWSNLLIGSVIAVVAQAGDFFESWLKRRAGVKDSGRLIPGHGGIFDRADGMIAVFFVSGIVLVASKILVSEALLS